MKQFVKKKKKKEKQYYFLWTSVPIWCFKTFLKNYHFLAPTQKQFSHPLLRHLKLTKESLVEYRSRWIYPLFGMRLAFKSCGKALKMFGVKWKTNRLRNETSCLWAIKFGCKNLLMTDSFLQFLCDIIPSKTGHLRRGPSPGALHDSTECPVPLEWLDRLGLLSHRWK